MPWRVAVALSIAALVSSAMIRSVAGEGDVARGARAFQKCFSCHSVDPAETKLPGPNLAHLFGRRAGTLPGFEYSAFMVAAGNRGLDWSEATLGEFIVDPASFVPGTTMSFPGMADAHERADLIAYLKTALPD